MHFQDRHPEKIETTLRPRNDPRHPLPAWLAARLGLCLFNAREIISFGVD